MPTDAGNNAVREARLGKALETLMERAKPEAAYFYAPDGERGGFIVFDLKEASDIPWIAEPLFMEVEANLELYPVMTPDDVRAGLKKAGFG